MTDYRKEAENKVLKRNQSHEVSFLVQDLLNQNNPNLTSTTSTSFVVPHLPQNASSSSLVLTASNKRKISFRGSSSHNIMDRSWVGRQDKEGILIYCSELNRQIESKNLELTRVIKECSHYKTIVDQRISELSQNGSNPLAGIVEQIQKERNELKEEIVQLHGSETYLREELSRQEGVCSNLEKVIEQLEIVLEGKDKQIQDLQCQIETGSEKTNRFKSEINNMHDIYDTKEKLQTQLENRISGLEDENAQLLQNLEDSRKQFQQNLAQLEGERDQIMTDSEHLEIIKEEIASAFEQTAHFVQEFSKTSKLNGISSIVLPEFSSMMKSFDFEIQADEVQAIKFIVNSLFVLFQQVEYGVNNILRLEEEAEVSRDRIDELQKDLVESVNIGQILKEKEIRMNREIETARQNQEEDKQAIHKSIIQERDLIHEHHSQKQNFQLLQQQLLTAQQEVASFREEMIARDSLQQAKDQQERLMRETIQELRLESEKFKNQKDVYSNVLFKLCHVLPQSEMEQLVQELISNSEQLFTAQSEQKQQEELMHTSEAELKMQIQEDSLNSRTIIAKRKAIEQIKSNCKLLVLRCRKLRDRENAILNEFDVITQTQRSQSQQVQTLQKQLQRTKSQLDYEVKQSKVITTSRAANLSTKESGLFKEIIAPKQGSNDAEVLRYSSYRYNDKENNNLSELEIKKVRYEETEPDLGHTSERMKGSYLKQSQYSEANTKDKIINNLLTQNYQLQNSVNTLKPSSVSMQTLQYTQNQQPLDKNTLLKLRLQDKLNSTNRNIKTSNMFLS